MEYKTLKEGEEEKRHRRKRHKLKAMSMEYGAKTISFKEVLKSNHITSIENKDHNLIALKLEEKNKEKQ